ncbi:MAG TPA: 4-hydroxy-tetrahydrodipicolinate reductase [Polyangia bacterium]|jgi:4-hydroxy-tetrahydrodipicolinate reductase|nr:4-hydroxy-tetrahydrodipicolinate reductase [Polyangia bacterium]
MAGTLIGVLGATGKMGGAIIRTILATPGATLAAAVERAGHPALGQDAGVIASGVSAGVPITTGTPANKTDVWIDFSIPVATLAAARAAASRGVAMVIGTTGLSPDDREELRAASRQIPIVFTPNMSVGVTMLLKLVADAARVLGPGYDLEIVETHHRAKRDAPSGTALRLAEALADATGRDLGATARYQRHGEIGPRTNEEIGIQTVRGGDVVGDHTVHFLGTGERIEITHRATSRDTFAHGAVRAALWLAGAGAGGTGQRRPPGLYDMRDVLGL